MRTTNRLCRCVAIATAFVMAAGVLAGSASAAGAQSSADCRSAGGYTIFYLNGISNTLQQANISRDSLKTAYGSSHNGEPITYKTLYNDTHGQIRDVSEVFDQKIREAVELGILTIAQITTLLIRITGYQISVTNSGTRMLAWVLSQVPIERVRQAGEGLGQFLDNLEGWFQQALTASTNWMQAQVRRFADFELLDAETRAIIDSHAATVRGEIASGRKPLIVSHSQGNLFANPVAQKVRVAAGNSSLGVLHVATPAFLTSGPHVTIDTDLIIASFWASNNAPLPNVMMIPLLSQTNHDFTRAYLRQGEQARTAVLDKVSAQLDSIVLQGGVGSDGLFSVTLTWDGPGDVDLHVFEPNGQQVFYGAKQGTLGYLDVDNTSALGPEHYYASCSSAAVGGTFLVSVANYSGADGRVATMQLSSASFVGEPVSITLGASTGPTPGFQLFRVGVTQGANGRLEVRQLPV